MRNLSDKELDAVFGGHGVRTGDVSHVNQRNTAIVVHSAYISIIQGNNINTGVQV
jgi:hypothetical protein